MRATVKKIHPLKTSRNHNSFIRVEFQLENGDWAKTDLCPDYRNFVRWKEMLRLGEGTVVSNVQMHPKRKNEINADSFPSISHEPLVPHQKPKPVITQEHLPLK